ncbi:hypothetical protein Agub_g15785, partial [Astrephomene gubernaculifera]
RECARRSPRPAAQHRMAHRRCLGLAAGDYPGGWYLCAGCVLAAAGIGAEAAEGYVSGLAKRWVVQAGSAVAARSAATYEAGRQRFLRFCVVVLRLSEQDASPRAR